MHPKRQDGKYENYAGVIFETKEDYLTWFKEIAQNYEPCEEFSQEEVAYRRGYSQGFFAACKNPDVKHSEVQDWRYNGGHTHPPGSIFEGKKFETKPTMDNFLEMLDDTVI